MATRSGVKWGVLEEFLEEEWNFLSDTTIPMGAYRDDRWLRAVASRTRGLEYVDTLFDMYRHNFERLKNITTTALRALPALEKELMVMTQIEKRYINPTQKIIEDAKSYGADAFTPEEAGTITHNLIPPRIYQDYRTGWNVIRAQAFINQEPVAYVVMRYDSYLHALLNRWYSKFRAGPVDYLGYATWAGVDAMDDTLMPRILTTEDPTYILKNEMPSRGVQRVIVDEKPGLKEKIIEDIDTKTTDKRRKLVKEHCNVSAVRKRIDRKSLRRWQKRNLHLARASIEKYREQMALEEEKRRRDKDGVI